MENQNYVFIPRSVETAEKVKEEYKGHEIPTTSDYIVFEAAREMQPVRGGKKLRERVKIYKDELYKKDNAAKNVHKGELQQHGKIHFVGASKKGAEYRKFDMEHDTERAVIGDNDSPMLKELHFDYRVVGSDEIGNGDIFKPIIVTAAYVSPENMEDLIRFNVQDSKEIKNQIDSIGGKLTGIYDFAKVVDGAIVRTEYLTFCSRILDNSEYDACQQNENKDKNKDDILREMHADVINALLHECPADYIMVDDFMSGKKERHAKFVPKLEFSGDRVFLREKADGLNMAVSCASVISSYFGNLYLKGLNEQLREQYGMTKELQPGANLSNEAFCAPLRELKSLMEKRGEDIGDFMRRYAKTSFENVAASEWMKR